MNKKYIAIIDYNAGNIKSVSNALIKIGALTKLTNSQRVIRNASAIILPGVGAFGDAMNNLEILNLTNLIRREIRKKPFLGICLGLQVLFEYSTEEGRNNGLGIFKGYVDRIPEGVKIPHIGWNQINILKKNSALFKNIENNENFYFVHSYYAVCEDDFIISSTTDYGIELTAGIEKDNIFALQFHPEKSSIKGLTILENFCNYVQEEG
ncbi:MAG: imidazole glycerol phosphate synthase subunit HisH [Actinobacteria bacterium]|nr:imidazole glycerol phosphate synthase subunit HisH [Actinomycetota bacterium]